MIAAPLVWSGCVRGTTEEYPPEHAQGGENMYIGIGALLVILILVIVLL